MEQSYMIVEQFVKDAGFNVIKEEQLKLLKCLIMSVHRHRQTEVYEDTNHDLLNKFFLDVILVFLGFDRDTYLKFSQSVRKDYLWVEKSEFKDKRKIILGRLLDRERIFITEKLHETFESAARENMKYEIDNVE
jgi:predicted metal-dependent HD superfamily phosphohydrolase